VSKSSAIDTTEQIRHYRAVLVKGLPVGHIRKTAPLGQGIDVRPQGDTQDPAISFAGRG